MSEFHFHSIFGEQIDRISPYFIYELILTISSWGLLHVVFYLFLTKLWPLIDVRTLFLLSAQYLQIFLLNIFRTWHFYSMERAAVGL